LTRRFLIPRDWTATSFEAFRSAWMGLLVDWSELLERSFVFAGREEPSDHAEEWLFLDERSNATLHLVRDWRLPPMDTSLCYAALTGPASQIDPLVERAWTLPWQHNRRSIADLAARGFTADPSLILLMALEGAGMPPVSEADAVMRDAFAHPLALIRYMAVFAVRQVGWVEYMQSIKSASTADADENVRMLASNTLARLWD